MWIFRGLINNKETAAPATQAKADDGRLLEFYYKLFAPNYDYSGNDNKISFPNTDTLSRPAINVGQRNMWIMATFT